MKKRYITSIMAAGLLTSLFAQQSDAPVTAVSDFKQSEVVTPVLGYNKSQPVVLPGLQSPLTFDAYVNRSNMMRAPYYGTSSGNISVIGTFGVMGEIGQRFDNSVSTNIDRVLILSSAKAQQGTAITFSVSIYNVNSSNNLPNGTAIGSKTFGVNDVTAATYSSAAGTTYNFTTWSMLTFASPVNVTGNFIVGVAIDEDYSTNYTGHDRVFLATNDYGSGDGMQEHRMVCRTVPGFSVTSTTPPINSDTWYDYQWMWALLSGANYYDCDLMVVPLVVGESAVGVGIDDVKAVSKGLTFLGHYPSPAKESVKINYSLDKSNNEVKVRVFDISGRTITELKENTVSSGKHSFDVDVTNLAAGEYFYTLTNDDGSISSHFMVVK